MNNGHNIYLTIDVHIVVFIEEHIQKRINLEVFLHTCRISIVHSFEHATEQLETTEYIKYSCHSDPGPIT